MKILKEMPKKIKKPVIYIVEIYQDDTLSFEYFAHIAFPFMEFEANTGWSDKKLAIKEAKKVAKIINADIFMEDS